MIFRKKVLEAAFCRSLKDYSAYTPAGITARRFCIWCARMIDRMDNQKVLKQNELLLRANEADCLLYNVAEYLSLFEDTIEKVPISCADEYYWRVEKVGILQVDNNFKIDPDELLKNIVDYHPEWMPHGREEALHHLQVVVNMLKEVIEC